MKERGFWNRYGLMLLGILLYGIDLTLIISLHSGCIRIS